MSSTAPRNTDTHVNTHVTVDTRRYDHALAAWGCELIYKE